MICYTDVKCLPPGKEVKVEVVVDPCKCEARLAFQKQTQAALQQLTAKHILPVITDGHICSKQFTVQPANTFYFYLTVCLIQIHNPHPLSISVMCLLNEIP